MQTLSQVSVGSAIQMNVQSQAGPQPISLNLLHQNSSQIVVGGTSADVNKVGDQLVTIASSGSAVSVDLTALNDPQTGQASVSLSVLRSLMISNVTPAVASTATANNLALSVTLSNGLAAIGLNGTTVYGAKTGTPNFVGGSLCLELGADGVAVDSTHKLISLSTPAGTNVIARFTATGR